MLVLSRRPGEKIVIGNEVVIEVVSISGDGVRLGIRAPYRSTLTLIDSVIADNHPLSWAHGEERGPNDSYDLLFAIDIDFDFGTWFVDNPRPVEPSRQASEMVLRRTSFDGEIVDRTL